MRCCGNVLCTEMVGMESVASLNKSIQCAKRKSNTHAFKFGNYYFTFTKWTWIEDVYE